MFSIDFDVDVSDFETAIVQASFEAPSILPDLGPLLAYYWQEVNERLSVYPPIWTGGKRRWNSERQRRAYFATNGFGHGIPYVRTYGLQNDWDVRVEGGRIIIVNTNPASRYVIGDTQQLMHKDTGWINMADEAFRILGESPAMDLIADAWAKQWTNP